MRGHTGRTCVHARRLTLSAVSADSWSALDLEGWQRGAHQAQPACKPQPEPLASALGRGRHFTAARAAGVGFARLHAALVLDPTWRSARAAREQRESSARAARQQPDSSMGINGTQGERACQILGGNALLGRGCTLGHGCGRVTRPDAAREGPRCGKGSESRTSAQGAGGHGAGWGGMAGGGAFRRGGAVTFGAKVWRG